MKALILLSVILFSMSMAGVCWLGIRAIDTHAPVSQDTAKIGLKTH